MNLAALSRSLIGIWAILFVFLIFFPFQLSFGGIVCWCIICECDMTPAKFRASLHMSMHQQEMKIPGFGVL